MQCFSVAQQQQHSSSGNGDVELLFLVPAPRVKPERLMKKMEHRSETSLQGVCIADQHCGSSFAMHRGSWNSRSSSTAAAAQQQWWQRRRGYRRKGRAWMHRWAFCFRSCTFAQFEKDERGHTAKFYCAVEYAKVTYTLDSSISVALCRTSRVVVREFHRASSERVFPRLLPCDLLTNKCAAAVNFFFLFFIPLLLARSPATTTAAVAQSLTTDSPVTTQLS